MTDFNLNFLPEEMLSEILRHAASNSVTDFVNIKLTCKAFLGASNYDYIFENVSMEKLNFLVPWRKREKVFLKRCKHAKNAEALYRKGMINFFKGKKAESGLDYLKKAAAKGHLEATYAYGIILMCLGLRKQGLQVLSSLNLTRSSNKTSLNIASCRSKTKQLLKNMWIMVSLSAPKNNAKVTKCINPKNSATKSNGWEEEASTNLISCCDSCFWDHEAAFFCSML